MQDAAHFICCLSVLQRSAAALSSQQVCTDLSKPMLYACGLWVVFSAIAFHIIRGEILSSIWFDYEL